VQNIFLLDYFTRLKAWHDLRQELKDADLETIVIKVDNFWQKCPIVNHYLHPADIDQWPNPWELIKDNEYCLYARGLGMIYTLILLGIKNIELVEAVDSFGDDIVLVTVSDNLILNYHPGTITKTTIKDFKITKKINISTLPNKVL
jgi:hypothetical protein